MGELIKHGRLIDDKELRDMLLQQHEKQLARYQGDFNRFLSYCEIQDREINVNSAIAYMKYTLVQEQRKQSTWDRRLAAIKKHLHIRYGITPTNKQLDDLRTLRKFYNEDQYVHLKVIQGKNAEEKQQLLDDINELEVHINGFTKKDIRMKAIALVNLVTANRPSEMVRLKVKDFNLNERAVLVHMKKQGEVKYKRLTRDCVTAIKQYIQKYQLEPDDYFVCRVTRHQTVVRDEDGKTNQMTEIGYNKLVQTKLHIAPYVFRKTQITAMHEAGASLPVIARQSGHKSLQTITDHYLNVRDREVDKYI